MLGRTVRWRVGVRWYVIALGQPRQGVRQDEERDQRVLSHGAPPTAGEVLKALRILDLDRAKVGAQREPVRGGRILLNLDIRATRGR